MQYSVKKWGKDFNFVEHSINIKGTRTKRLVRDNEGNLAIFKYESDYLTSESVSEKLSEEIALFLGYDTAKIEFAWDEDGKLGVLNYLFADLFNHEHIDAIAFLKKEDETRKEFYTLDNIKKCLDDLDKNLFFQFIKILFFDALVGEYDRHEENWGVRILNQKYKISPLYDNGCNLLREFKDPVLLDKYDKKIKDFDSYINRCQAYIYDNSGKRMKHFDLIRKLAKDYPLVIKKECVNLCKFTDSVINSIVKKVPDYIISLKHQEYIIKYLQKRRDILLEIGDEINE